MSQQNTEKKLYDLLTTKNFDNFEVFDSKTSKPPIDPVSGQEDVSRANMYKFDWTSAAGHNYGTAVILLTSDGNLEIYFGDNLGRGMDSEDKTDWYEFLHQLKNFATKNFKSFSPKNLNQLRYTMQGQAAIKEGLFESWSGTKTQSWNGKQTEARLMIKHKRPLGENDARFRYVESLFIETAEGERYKLPFTKLSGGRAMVEHVKQGGRPYDARGQHITEMVNELNVLSRFRRANHGKIFEGDTAQLVEQTNAYYESAQKALKHLSSSRGYATYFEAWNPNETTEQEVVIEGLKHLFVTQSIDQRIEDALPLLARIQQQENNMKEASIFESWADRLMEGTWALPDTPEQQAKLVELLSKPLTVGADATNATEQLYDLFGDDELFDQLETLAAEDPDADCRQVVMDRMDMLSDHPEVRAVIDRVQIDPEATMNPAEPTDAGMSADQDDAQIPTNESDYEEYQDDLASILRIAGVPAEERPAPDYELEEEETDEGVLGTLGGGLIGGALGGPLGAIAGAGIGQAATSGGSGIIEQGEEETDEGWKGQLAGGTVGTLAGAALGAVGGPIGSMIGGAVGGTAGQMAGDALGGNEETDEGVVQDVAKGAGEVVGDIAAAPTTAATSFAKAASDVFGTEKADEGKLGAVAGGALGGAATRSVKGAVAGAKLGSAIQDRYAKKKDEPTEDLDVDGVMMTRQTNCSSESVEPKGTSLQGQYGHSGTMKPVAEDADFLDRLKELAGMMRSDKI